MSDILDSTNLGTSFSTIGNLRALFSNLANLRTSFSNPMNPVNLLNPSQIPGDFVKRPLGSRESDALWRPFAHRFQPFEREREVRPALGRHQGVNLVDDHR